MKLEPIRSRHGVPALAAVLAGSGGIRAIGAAGVRRLGSAENVTADDLFHIGSNTKAMTATLCAILVEEGELKWESTVAEVFPDLAARMDPGWHHVTLEQLLRHEGGAPADLDAGGLWQKLWDHKGTPASARRLLLTGVTSEPPAYAPGTSTIYSNAGYAIAGHMAETVSRQAWEDLMREKLFRPLEMNTAGFGPPGAGGRTDQPRGHQPDGTPREPGPGADNPAAIGPAGIVHCTLADYAKFLVLHLDGANGRARLLQADSFKKLHTAPENSQFGMDWLVVKNPATGSTMLTHSGSNTFWYCTALVLPDRDIAVAVACNQAGPGEKACDEAIAALMQQSAGH